MEEKRRNEMQAKRKANGNVNDDNVDASKASKLDANNSDEKRINYVDPTGFNAQSSTK